MAGRRGRGTRRRAMKRGGVWWVLALAALAAAVVIGARVLHVAGPPPTSRAGMDLFFVRYSDGGRTGGLVAVQRPAVSGVADARVEAALRRLLVGPSAAERAKGIVSEVPAGTGLRRVTLSGGVATVDLTAAFSAGGGSTSMLARVWQVVYTATQIPEVHAVQILIGGRHVRALGGEGVMIDRPIERPASMPAF
ncbi:MAG TPA: GerMN domain-containing protein [bacterium]|nr:GerMN domain-containing protein [bacterium]